MLSGDKKQVVKLINYSVIFEFHKRIVKQSKVLEKLGDFRKRSRFCTFAPKIKRTTDKRTKSAREDNV